MTTIDDLIGLLRHLNAPEEMIRGFESDWHKAKDIFIEQNLMPTTMGEWLEVLALWIKVKTGLDVTVVTVIPHADTTTVH